MTDSAHRHEHVANLLNVFKRKHVDALLQHFSDSIRAFEGGEWETCIQKAGKFVEAVIKALAEHAELELPNARQFKVGVFIEKLRNTDNKSDDSIRLLIPRNCCFVYDIASNRGSRHDQGDIDPNKMDAIAVVQNISWVLAEMVRLAHMGTLRPDDAANVVDSLMEKRYPDIEEIDDRLYVNRDGLTTPDIALLLLERKYPARFGREELMATLLRHHGITKNNAKVTMTRIKKFTDDDGQGNLKLRANGRQRATQIRARRKI